MSNLIHPDLLTSLPNHYPDTCTIQEKTESRDAAGEIQASWSNLADHVDIPCAVASQGGEETETPQQTFVPSTYRIALTGYYPDITEEMRAVVGSTNYDIERAHHDSQSVSTYLDCEVVE